MSILCKQATGLNAWAQHSPCRQYGKRKEEKKKKAVSGKSPKLRTSAISQPNQNRNTGPLRHAYVDDSSAAVQWLAKPIHLVALVQMIADSIE